MCIKNVFALLHFIHLTEEHLCPFSFCCQLSEVTFCPLRFTWWKCKYFIKYSIFEHKLNLQVWMDTFLITNYFSTQWNVLELFICYGKSRPKCLLLLHTKPFLSGLNIYVMLRIWLTTVFCTKYNKIKWSEIKTNEVFFFMKSIFVSLSMTFFVSLRITFNT